MNRTIALTANQTSSHDDARAKGETNIARKRPRDAAADQRRRQDGHRSEGHPAAEPGPAPTHPTGSLIESPERTQVKHELALALTDLGGATFVLAHHGALTDNRLESRVRRIHDLYERLDAVAHATYSRPRDDDQAEYLAA
jgi:hypothetical protein